MARFYMHRVTILVPPLSIRGIKIMERYSRSLGLAFVLFPLVLTGGCLNATYIPTNITAQPARNMQCDIEVISAGVPEDKMFEELGIVEAEGSWWKSDLEDLLPKMMEQGCLAGGDALILQSSDMYSVGEDSTIPVQRISATVIRWMTE